jgi:hypothetical protein
LLTVPIGGAFLYVEPLYIQATGGKIPELKRVIVATQKDVGYGSSLAEALHDLFGPEVAALAPAREGEVAAPMATATSPAPTEAAEGGAVPAAASVQSAAEHLRRYQKLMGDGRAAEAGGELDRLARDLEALSGGGGPARR